MSEDNWRSYMWMNTVRILSSCPKCFLLYRPFFFSSYTHLCLLLFCTLFLRNASCLGCLGPDSKKETEMHLTIAEWLYIALRFCYSKVDKYWLWKSHLHGEVIKKAYLQSSLWRCSTESFCVTVACLCKGIHFPYLVDPYNFFETFIFEEKNTSAYDKLSLYTKFLTTM